MLIDNQIIPIFIENELKSSFIDYSMSVIVSRALPDVRDGLKPVHRRILYAMYGQKNFHNRPYFKSARIVGDVIGRYHPHGDSSVYEALVRMAQDFSLRYQLVDGQGNFGSLDGDPPAAMRYTESRMCSITEQILADIEMDTVDFVPNYDNKETEPVVLPSRLPQLLINGASGIAVGMATNIPPHNISEVIDGLLALIDKPSITISELMDHIKGPDFPTAAFVQGVESIKKAYETGRGVVSVHAETSIEVLKNGKEQIIVREIPYQVNKAKLIEKIADLVRNKKIEGISDLRDESARKDIRVVIELKKGESSDIILNKLYKFTPMKTSFGINIVALVGGVPKLLSLKDLLREFYYHRQEVIIRRTAFRLRRAKERLHILIALKIVVENINDIISIIRNSNNSDKANSELKIRYNLTNIQAKAVLDMRLARLTGLEREKIIKEHEEILKLINNLKDILENKNKVIEIIKKDLNELKEKYGDERRTKIIAAEAGEFNMENFVADDQVIITVTHGGYIKRTPLAAFQAQKHGGKGRRGMIMKGDDFIDKVFHTTNHQFLLCFSNFGKIYQFKVYEIPEAAIRARGLHFANLLTLAENERIVSILTIKKYVENYFILSLSKRGYVKKTDLMAYTNIYSNGIIALKLDKGDELIDCQLTSGQDEILISTRLGKAIRFSESDIRPTARSSRGVIGIRFSDELDYVISLEILNSKATILSVCENGFGKRSRLDAYRRITRGGQGTMTIKVSKRNGPVIGVSQVEENDHVLMMTSSGKIVRFMISELSVRGRLTQGVKLMNIEKGERVVGFTKVDEILEEE